MRELLRVARKTVVITVPYESQEELGHYSGGQELHRHLHTFCPESFDSLKSETYDMTAKEAVCPICDTGKEGASKRNVELAWEEQKTFFALQLRNPSIHMIDLNKDSFEMTGWTYMSGKKIGGQQSLHYPAIT